MNRTWKILLVDDDEEDYLLTRIMASAARGAKIQLSWARSFGDGKKTLQEDEPFDAVLVDYDLGLYSGIDLIKEFTSQEYPAPFILFTGRGTYEVDLLAMQAGATLYLTKAEANSLLLERAIRYAIERKQSEDALKQSNEELSRVNQELKSELLERERAENALRESEKKYRDLVGNLSEGVWVVDGNGKTIFVNQQMADMLGYSVDEMQDCSMVSFLDEAGQESYPKEMERQKQGLREQLEQTFITKGGQPIHALLTTAPIFTHGSFSGYIAGVLDITDRKRINQALMEREERFRTTVESMLDGLAIFTAIRNPEGEIIDFNYDYINHKGCQLEGKELTDLVDHTMVELKHPFIQGEYFQRLVEVVETGEPLEFRRVYLDKSPRGKELVKSQEIRAFKSGDGLVITWRDTTEQEQIGKRLEKSEKEARLQLSEIESIYRTAPVGLCVLDRDLRFVRINEKLAEINGYSPEDHLGRTVRELMPEIADQSEELARQVIQTGEPALDVEISGETPAQPGVKRTWLEQWHPLRDAKGEIIGINVVAEEITERKRYEEELRQQRQKLALAHEAAGICSLDLDLINNKIAWSSDLEKFFGFQPGGFDGSPERLVQLVVDEDRKLVRKAFQAGVQAGESDVRFRIKHWGTGETRWIVARGNFTLDANQKPERFVGILMDVTERTRIENQLRESENRTLELIRHAPTGIYEIDLNETRFLSVNEALIQILGYTREEFLSANPLDLLDEASKAVFIDRMRKTMAGEPVDQSVEYGIIAKDGRRIDVVLNTNMIYKNGRPDTALVIAHDITERKRSEQALRESEERYRCLFESLVEGMALLEFVFDEAGKPVDYGYLNINPAFEAIFGVKKMELVGRRVSETEKSLPYLEELGKVAVTGEPVTFETYQARLNKHLKISAYSTGQGLVSVMFTDLTAAKKAEEALKQGEEKFKALFDLLPVGVSILDEKREVQYANPALGEIFGVPLVDILRGDFHHKAYYRPDGTKKPVEEMPSALAFAEQRKFENVEIKVEKESGETCWVNVSAVPLPFPDWRVVVTTVDITGRKRAEQALRKSEQRLQIQIENSPMAFIEWDADFRISRWAGEAQNIFGWSEAEMLGKSISEANLIYPEDTPVVDGVMEQLTDRVSSKVISKNRNITKDGRVIHCEWRNSVFFDEGGNMASVLSLVADITAQVELVEALRRRTEELENLLDAIPAIVWIAQDPGCREITGNRTANSLLKVPPGSNVSLTALAEADSIFLRQLKPDGSEYQTDELPIQQAVAQGRPVRDVVIDMHFKDGRKVTILGDAMPLFDTDGNVRGAVGAFKDITELTQIQKSLQEYTQQLKRSNMALEEFTYIASHDLQEPLRKIRSFSNQLKTHYANVLGETGLDWLERMRSAAQRMEEMISGLLEYAHLTSEAEPFAPVNLNEVAREALVNLEARVRSSRGKVKIGDLPTVSADRLQMQQLFQNLIGNALKFHRQGVPPVVRLESRPGMPGFVEIYVHDNGIGFDVDLLDQIFQPFQRLHGRAEYEGTGIGLAICRKIVERHGGSITALSTVGEGSTFIVTLPVSEEIARKS